MPPSRAMLRAVYWPGVKTRISRTRGAERRSSRLGRLLPSLRYDTLIHQPDGVRFSRSRLHEGETSGSYIIPTCRRGEALHLLPPRASRCFAPVRREDRLQVDLADAISGGTRGGVPVCVFVLPDSARRSLRTFRANEHARLVRSRRKDPSVWWQGFVTTRRNWRVVAAGSDGAIGDSRDPVDRYWSRWWDLAVR